MARSLEDYFPKKQSQHLNNLGLHERFQWAVLFAHLHCFALSVVYHLWSPGLSPPLSSILRQELPVATLREVFRKNGKLGLLAMAPGKMLRRGGGTMIYINKAQTYSYF